MNLLPPSLTISVPALPAGWTAAAYAILADGTLAILGDDQRIVGNCWSANRDDFDPDAYRLRVNSARARLWTFDGQTLTTHFELPLEDPFLAIDRLSDGLWLVVARRTMNETNARLFEADGQLVARFMLGDGIQSVKTDAADRIWVGWFDEGVFGNSNWNVPRREWPPSSSVVAAFDRAGAVVWELAAGSWADCYALNVTGEDAWTWMYGDAPPIQRLSVRAQPQLWSCEGAGATALAVDNKHVLVAGGYGPAWETMRVLRLGVDGSAEALATWKADLPRGAANQLILVDGRADRIHAVVGQEWRQWVVSDAVSAAQ